MADIKWIKMSTGLPGNKKLTQIRTLPDGDKIALMWVFLLCLAGEVNEQGLIYLTPEVPYTEEMLAEEFRMDINVIRLGLATFQRYGMIEIVDDIICLSSWEKWQAADKMETIREQTRKRVAKHREKQKQIACNASSNANVTQCNATEQELELDLELENKKNSAKQPSKNEIDLFFESVWELYPNKKGKGQVSDAKKKTLFSVGFDELKRAVERYLKDLEKDKSWRKPQNGSTFFNSGYIDYLDKNYTQGRQDTSSANLQSDMTDLDDLF